MSIGANPVLRSRSWRRPGARIATARGSCPISPRRGCCSHEESSAALRSPQHWVSADPMRARWDLRPSTPHGYVTYDGVECRRCRLLRSRVLGKRARHAHIRPSGFPAGCCRGSGRRPHRGMTSWQPARGSARSWSSATGGATAPRTGWWRSSAPPAWSRASWPVRSPGRSWGATGARLLRVASRRWSWGRSAGSRRPRTARSSSSRCSTQDESPSRSGCSPSVGWPVSVDSEVVTVRPHVWTTVRFTAGADCLAVPPRSIDEVGLEVSSDDAVVEVTPSLPSGGRPVLDYQRGRCPPAATPAPGRLPGVWLLEEVYGGHTRLEHALLIRFTPAGAFVADAGTGLFAGDQGMWGNYRLRGDLLSLDTTGGHGCGAGRVDHVARLPASRRQAGPGVARGDLPGRARRAVGRPPRARGRRAAGAPTRPGAHGRDRLPVRASRGRPYTDRRSTRARGRASGSGERGRAQRVSEPIHSSTPAEVRGSASERFR